MNLNEPLKKLKPKNGCVSDYRFKPITNWGKKVVTLWVGIDLYQVGLVMKPDITRA